MRWQRRVRDRITSQLDIEIFRSASAPVWPEARFTRDLINRLNPDCFFDVGANEGLYAQSLRALGYTGNILSFEPNPSAYQRMIVQSSRDHYWHCFPYALGSASTRMQLNVMQVDLFSSFHQPTANTEAPYSELNIVDHAVEVDVKTIDDVFLEFKKRYKFNRPFLKMDTQGFDVEVIRGAAHSAKQFVGLLSEVSMVPIYDGMPSMEESLRAYRQSGFQPVQIFDVHPEDLLAAMVEANCYCVREDLLAVPGQSS